MINDGLTRDRVAVLLLFGFTGEDRDVLDLVDLYCLRLAPDEMVTALGLLSKNSGLAMGDGPLQNVVIKKQMNFVRRHVQRALLNRHIPTVDPSACGEIDLDVLRIDNGRLVAITVKGDRDLCRIKKRSKEQKKQAAHGEILANDSRITGWVRLVATESENWSVFWAGFEL